MRIKLLVGLTVPAFALAIGLWAAAPASAVWPGANGKIMFFKFSFAPIGQIFSVNPNGTGETNLSAAGGGAGQIDIQPSVSPNGRFIAFARLVPIDPTHVSAQLWVMRSNGTGQTDVSNDAMSFSESGPAWTPDGSKLLFVQQSPGTLPFGGSPGGSIWIRNADGSGTPQLVDAGPNDANPAMSPNGQMIAFSRQVSPPPAPRQLFVMNSDGTDLTDYGPGSKPDWSPDGDQIVYGQAGTGPIMVVNVGHPASAHVLLSGTNEAPVWSPDGSKIAFDDCTVAGAGTLCQIAVMSATGQNPHDITNEPILSDQKPDWQALTQNDQGQDNSHQGQNNNNQ
jgi:Tol biopolymer transport system component